MTEIRPRQGSIRQRAGMDGRTASLWTEGQRALRRYLMLATGISSTAVGLVLIVSLIAAAQGGPGRAALAAGDGVGVRQLDGRTQSALLDPVPQAAALEQEPLTAAFPVASPAPTLQFVGPPPASELDAPQSEVVLASSLPSIGLVTNVNVTFYDCLVQGFCGAMYNGEQVYEGAAACSWDLPLGTRFVIQNDPTGRTYICADRGYLADTWVDIFFYSPDDGWAWQQQVGRYSSILIISVPVS